MDIVDLGAPAHSGDDGTWAEAAETGWIGRRLAMLRRCTPSQMSAVLLVLGFVLVMASQWFPWIRVTHRSAVTSDFGTVGVRKTSGMVDSGGVLQIPYYVLWLVVFAAGGALVYLTGRRQRAAFGVAAGALASQLLIVVPVLHRPVDQLVNAGPYETAGIKVVHVSGSYLVIVAFVVLAAAFVVAVGGRIFPTSADDRSVEQIDRDAIGRHAAGTMHEAIADSTPRHDDAVDTEVGWSPNRIAVRSEEIPADDAELRPEPNDHSIYRRPARSDEANVI